MLAISQMTAMTVEADWYLQSVAQVVLINLTDKEEEAPNTSELTPLLE